MTELDNLFERQLVRKIDIAKRGGVIFTILFNSFSASPLSICFKSITIFYENSNRELDIFQIFRNSDLLEKLLLCRPS